MQKSKGGFERVLIKKELLTPSALNISSNDIEKYILNENTFKILIDKIKNNLSKNINTLSFLNPLNEILDKINDLDIFKKDFNDDILKTLLGKHNKLSFNYELTLDNSYEDWESITIADKNNIQVAFGEILCGLLLAKNYIYSTNSECSLYWPKNSNEYLNDFYFNSIGYSVKSNDSSQGHRPSIINLTKKIIKSVENEHDLEIIKNNAYGFGFTDELIDGFIKRLKLFFDIERPNQHKNIWRLSNSLFNVSGSLDKITNTNYLKFIKYLGLENENLDTYIPDPANILYTVDHLTEEERQDLMKTCANLANNKKGLYEWINVKWESTNIKDTEYYINNGKSITYTKNYSKIMYPLVNACINELNNLYCSTSSNDNYTTNIFSIFANNVLESNQCETKIENVPNKEKTIKITINLYSLGKSLLEFSNAGSGPSNWNGHGTIGFTNKTI
jgi:hypothetical protein